MFLSMILALLLAHAYYYFHILIHELAHAVIMKLFGVRIETIHVGGNVVGFDVFGVRCAVGPYPDRGGCICAEGVSMPNSKIKAVTIYLMGPIVDFVLSSWVIAYMLIYHSAFAPYFIGSIAFWWVSMVLGSLSEGGDLNRATRILSGGIPLTFKPKRA